jgi:hypothetical protein
LYLAELGKKNLSSGDVLLCIRGHKYYIGTIGGKRSEGPISSSAETTLPTIGRTIGLTGGCRLDRRPLLIGLLHHEHDFMDGLLHEFVRAVL